MRGTTIKCGHHNILLVHLSSLVENEMKIWILHRTASAFGILYCGPHFNMWHRGLGAQVCTVWALNQSGSGEREGNLGTKRGESNDLTEIWKREKATEQGEMTGRRKYVELWDGRKRPMKPVVNMAGKSRQRHKMKWRFCRYRRVVVRRDVARW